MELVIGRMRSGKTFGSYDGYEGRELIVDPQGDLARLYIEQKLGHGYGDSLIVDEGARTDRTLQTIHIYEETAGSELDRLRQDQIELDDLKNMIYAKRNLAAPTSPLIDERLSEALELFQYQKEWKPLYWLPKLSDTWSREYGELMRGCHNRLIRDAMEKWCYFQGTQQRIELGPFKRVVAPALSDAAIMARCGDLAVVRVIVYQTIVVMCEGMAREGRDFLCNWWIHQAIRMVEKYGAPIRVTVDESVNIGTPGRGVFSDRVLNAIRMEEKHGLQFRFIMQTLSALEPDVRSELLDTASRVTVYALSDPESVMYMARLMSTPTLDSHRIIAWDTDHRQYHDGFEEVKKGYWDKDGKFQASSRDRPKYRIEEVRRPVRQNLSDQEKMVAQEIMKLGKQERMVFENGNVRKERVPNLENPWLWPEVSREKVDQFLEEVIWRDEYQTPSILKPSAKQWQPRGRGDKKRKR